MSEDAHAIEAALAEIEAREKRNTGRGVGITARLMFGLDLTESRKATLDDARISIAAMFKALSKINAGIAVKLAYFRGWDGECRASEWHTDPEVLTGAMERLSCKSGETQIAKILRLALRDEKPSGVIYVGDTCEEKSAELVGLAAALGQKRTPIFVFHDLAGNDPDAVKRAEPVFRRMAEVSGGAYSAFGEGSAAALRELLSTVAAFSSGGAAAVQRIEPVTTPQAKQLQARLLLGPGGDR